MFKNISKLIDYDFRRMWTLPLIIFSALFSLIVILITVLPLTLNWMGLREQIPYLDYAIALKEVFNFAVPVLAVIFSAGMVSFDIRNHWLRTLMSRAVTRPEYLTGKVFAAGISIFALMLLLGTLPMTIVSLFSGIPIRFDFWFTLLVHIFYLLDALLILYIGALLSCFLPTFVNAFVLIFWMILNAWVLPLLVSFLLWDETWAVILEDFFFPSGLTEAVGMIVSGAAFPWQDFLWGIGGLLGFAALAYWTITVIQIDKGSD